MSARQTLQDSKVGPLHRRVTDLENKVKGLSDEIADNANKIDRLMGNITATD